MHNIDENSQVMLDVFQFVGFVFFLFKVKNILKKYLDFLLFNLLFHTQKKNLVGTSCE